MPLTGRRRRRRTSPSCSAGVAPRRPARPVRTWHSWARLPWLTTSGANTFCASRRSREASAGFAAPRPRATRTRRAAPRTTRTSRRARPGVRGGPHSGEELGQLCSTPNGASCTPGNADRTLLLRPHTCAARAPRRHGAAAVLELCAGAGQKVQPQRRRLLVGGDHVGRRRLDLERHGARGVPVRADGLERVRRLRRGGAGPDVAPLRPARLLGGRPRPQGADRRERRRLHRGGGGGRRSR